YPSSLFPSTSIDKFILALLFNSIELILASLSIYNAFNAQYLYYTTKNKIIGDYNPLFILF
ncbi:MAG: hypothetical protein KC414_08010, partial [Romboutsia sp.]|nr:hypothetical protein [Romboutsia sp.]